MTDVFLGMNADEWHNSLFRRLISIHVIHSSVIHHGWVTWGCCWVFVWAGAPLFITPFAAADRILSRNTQTFSTHRSPATNTHTHKPWDKPAVELTVAHCHTLPVPHGCSYVLSPRAWLSQPPAPDALLTAPGCNSQNRTNLIHFSQRNLLIAHHCVTHPWKMCCLTDICRPGEIADF